jgi:hypothetical protein
MQNIIDATIAKIKKQGIVPAPRWRYLLKKYGIWSIFFFIVLLSSISFSVAFDILRQLDWDLYRFAHQSAFLYVLSLLPYFWIIIIAIFLVLSFFDLRKTESGYRYSWLRMSLITIGIMIMAGFIFSSLGVGNKLNARILKDVPYYGQYMMTKETQWMQPEKGFLSGTLVTVHTDKLDIIDLDGHAWSIFLDEETLIKPSAVIKVGEMIKIIGSKKDVNGFHAVEIRPWMGQGKMGRGQNHGNKVRNGSGEGKMKGE